MLGLYNFPAEDSAQITDILANIPHLSNSRVDFAKLSRSLEGAKLNTLVRLAESKLEADPHAQVMLCVQYIEHMNILNDKLAKHNPALVRLHNFEASASARLIICSRSAFAKLKLEPQYVFLTRGMDMPEYKHNIIFVYDKNNTKEIHFTARRIRRCPQFTEE